MKSLISWKVVAPLFIVWLLVCPVFRFVDMVLTAGIVERWMERQGIAVADIIDAEGLSKALGETDDPFMVDPRDYVINEELYYAVAEVATLPHELPFFWYYQRWEYHRKMVIGLTAMLVMVLIAKELTGGKANENSLHRMDGC